MIIDYAYNFNTCGQVTCLSNMQGGHMGPYLLFKGQTELRQQMDLSGLCPNDCRNIPI